MFFPKMAAKYTSIVHKVGTVCAIDMILVSSLVFDAREYTGNIFFFIVANLSPVFMFHCNVAIYLASFSVCTSPKC